MIRPGDIAVVGLGFALVLVLGLDIYGDDPAHTVQVMHADSAPENFPAWQDRQVRVTGPLGETVLQIQDGRVRIVQSPCTRKLCIRADWLEFAGAATACVPNRVSVVLLGDDPRFDAMNF